ncbi:MAG: hypothetical protein ACTHU0_28225 [Kofleriaceae bacterium]
MQEVVLAVWGGHDGPGPIIIIDAPPPATVCDPVKQTGCNAGEKCTWIFDRLDDPDTAQDEDLGHIGCAPAGDAAVGEACWFGGGEPKAGVTCTTTADCGNADPDKPDHVCNRGQCVPRAKPGTSNCVAGADCISGECKSVCDPQVAAASSGCDGMHACASYSGFYEDADGNNVAGVCDPLCDPLKQERLAGSTTAACGSRDPAAPNAACYISRSSTFGILPSTCAPIPANITDKRATAPVTDRQPAYGPGGFGSSPSYVNGCEAGYIPLLAESTGSMVRVCVGLCAPKKTDNTLTGNAQGDAAALAKLWNSAAPAAGDGMCQIGKKGSMGRQNCLFIWPLHNDGNVYLEGPYDESLGYCFAYTEYQYDPDGNGPITQLEGVPGCEELPPKDYRTNCSCDANGRNCSGTGCPKGLAHEWDCYGRTETLTPPTAAKAAGNVPMTNYVSKRARAVGEQRLAGELPKNLARHQLQ